MSSFYCWWKRLLIRNYKDVHYHNMLHKLLNKIENVEKKTEKWRKNSTVANLQPVLLNSKTQGNPFIKEWVSLKKPDSPAYKNFLKHLAWHDMKGYQYRATKTHEINLWNLLQINWFYLLSTGIRKTLVRQDKARVEVLSTAAIHTNLSLKPVVLNWGVAIFLNLIADSTQDRCGLMV
jgi:hypothetical protein